MPRNRDPHPLGKCAEERIEISVPTELKRRLTAIAALHDKTHTAWARDVLEKAIEGEWAYMRRRVGGANTGGLPEELPGELTGRERQ